MALNAGPLITAEGVEKSFGSAVALSGIDVSVDAGTVLALLGRNGAGKRSFVGIPAALPAPDAGRVRIGGVDVVREAKTVRWLIGLAGQFAAVDETLSGRENLARGGRPHGRTR